MNEGFGCAVSYRLQVVNTTKSPAIAKIADRTAYGTLINHHMDDNTLPYW